MILFASPMPWFHTYILQQTFIDSYRHACEKFIRRDVDCGHVDIFSWTSSAL